MRPKNARRVKALMMMKKSKSDKKEDKKEMC